MEEKAQNKSLNLIDRHSTYKLIVSKLAQLKIREWCYNFPTKEWSGTMFYKVEGNFEDGSLTITCVDIYVSDIGSGTYTEFDHTSDIVNYQIENNLLDCYTGLIHSHNQMATFFSGTDRSTLIEEGMTMPHFVSLIVNNAGKYTAKITRRVLLEAIKISYPTFNDGHKTEDAESNINEYIEAFPLDIEIEEDTSIKDEVSKRIKEIEELKKTKEVSTPIQPYTAANINTNTPEVESPKEYKNSFYQPTLFPVSPANNSNKLKVPEDVAQVTLIQLITGSITAIGKNFDINKWCFIMEKAYFRRFSGDMEKLRGWLDCYTEYLVWNTFWTDISNDVDNAELDAEEVASAIASKLLEKCNQLPNNKVLEMIKEQLEQYII